MTPVDIRLEGVSKQYRLTGRRDAPSFWAVQDVSAAIPRGSATGIIGRNGAGKSTLLKLLAGITTPTRGRITIDGRLAALIEVGSGFHPELTGRENVFLSGTILGMARRDIAAKLESIVEFAGVSAFLDTPVKWYSSGMYVRLGFSIAAHLDPDILLVDEVLAVGDAEFQARCLERVHALRTRGTTIVLISHDLTAVEKLCDRTILLDGGRIAADGASPGVIAEYQQRLTGAARASEAFAPIARAGIVRLTNLITGAADAGPAITGAPLITTIRFAAARALALRFELSYYGATGRTLVGRTTADVGAAEMTPPGGAIEFTCRALPLPPGTYYVAAVVRELDTGHVLDWWDGNTVLHVASAAHVEGLVWIPHEWRLCYEERTASVTGANGPPSAPAGARVSGCSTGGTSPAAASARR